MSWSCAETDRVSSESSQGEDSRVRWFEDNQHACEESMRKEQGADWQPHRICCEHLTRA
jgi:hypothetical protein